MRNMTKKTKEAGFTLVELLIVIIIIGILAAIAFVAYSGAQNSANKGAAQSTLSEVRSQLAVYNSDNGYYPATIVIFDAWLNTAAGGNNVTLANTYANPNYTYTASPAACVGVACTGYSTTASASIAGGTAITVTN